MENKFNQDAWDINAMKAKIENIERLVIELNQLGIGIPAVEKNTGSMLNCIYVLKFGISDIAELENT